MVSKSSHEMEETVDFAVENSAQTWTMDTYPSHNNYYSKYKIRYY